MLQSGTYEPQVMERVVCYDYVDAYYTTCSGGMHHNGEEFGPLSEGKCPEPTQSVLVITVTRRCNDIAVGGNDEGGTPSIPSEGGGNHGGGGTAPSTQPCEGNGVPSQPQDPNSTIGGNEGCNSGTPTLPNLEFNPPTTPCEKVNQANLKAKALLEQKTIKDSLAKASQTVLTDTIEKGFNFGIKSDGSYTTSEIKKGATSSVSLQPTDYTFTVTGSAHTHNGTYGYECPSAGDIATNAVYNKLNPSFVTSFVVSAGSIYNISVIDPQKAKDFATNYPKSQYVETNPQSDDSGHWKPGSTIRADFDKIINIFLKQGKSHNEAGALAQAYILKKYDTGMVMSKKQPGGSFKSIFVSENKNPNNPNASTYQQTDNCNL
ncbi:hypothetical protein AB4Y90_16600 [Chryseobacterium sp. 2TAF14]|uniref:hypothetical protein n=1 Tax=Chryseobacterium sp. 2TAF14 TaxID=3233007 RepID=UPI003F8E22A6